MVCQCEHLLNLLNTYFILKHSGTLQFSAETERELALPLHGFCSKIGRACAFTLLFSCAVSVAWRMLLSSEKYFLIFVLFLWVNFELRFYFLLPEMGHGKVYFDVVILPMSSEKAVGCWSIFNIGSRLLPLRLINEKQAWGLPRASSTDLSC